jgi:hypothetical protein
MQVSWVLFGDEALALSILAHWRDGNAFCARGAALLLSGRNDAPRKTGGRADRWNIGCLATE